MVQAKNSRDPPHAQMTRDGDGQFEYFDRFQSRAEPLHQQIIDRFVIAREPIGVLQHELFTVGEQRVVAIVVYRGVDVFSDFFRARRKSPLESNRAPVDVGDEEADELSLSHRQLAAVVDGGVERPDCILEGR